MNLLLEIYKKIILKENAASVTSVTDSIKNKYRVNVNYEGDPSHGIAPGPRTIEVYAYGLTKAGNPVIRAYQPYGDTASTTPGWKFFRIDRIKSWEPTYSLVTKPAPGFNPNGDKTMSAVYLIANFNDTSANGEKQTYKQVGQLNNIDKILADREREKATKKNQEKTANKFTAQTPAQKPQIKTTEPEIKGTEEIPKQEIPEPEINGVAKPQEMPSQPNISEPQEEPINNLYKTKGEEELDKIKDLNRRLDNARKIDLSNIPKR